MSDSTRDLDLAVQAKRLLHLRTPLLALLLFNCLFVLALPFGRSDQSKAAKGNGDPVALTPEPNNTHSTTTPPSDAVATITPDDPTAPRDSATTDVVRIPHDSDVQPATVPDPTPEPVDENPAPEPVEIVIDLDPAGTTDEPPVDPLAEWLLAKLTADFLRPATGQPQTASLDPGDLEQPGDSEQASVAERVYHRVDQLNSLLASIGSEAGLTRHAGTIWQSTPKWGRGLNSARASQRIAISWARFFASLAKNQPTPPGIVLLNPANTGGVVHFVVDGDVMSLQPGESVDLGSDQTRLIQFHRGGEFGIAEFSLNDGEHKFVVTATGWDLAKSATQ